MQVATVVVGVDVAKLTLVSAFFGQPGVARTVDNRNSAIAAWLAELPKGSIMAMEATGAHHRMLAHMAHAAGMQVYVLNARDVYFYAKALSGRAKTDRLDAAVIARYAAEHYTHLHAWRPAAGVEQQLHELLQRRACITRLRVSLRQTLADVASLQAARRQLDDSFECFFKQLDAQLQALVASDAELAAASLGCARSPAWPAGLGGRGRLAQAHRVRQRRCPGGLQRAGPQTVRLGPAPRPAPLVQARASLAAPPDVPGGVRGQSQQGAQAAVQVHQGQGFRAYAGPGHPGTQAVARGLCGLERPHPLRSSAPAAQFGLTQNIEPRTGAASQSTKRAARADPSPVRLAAPQIAPAGYRLPRKPPVLVFRSEDHHCSRKGAPGQVAARLRGAEERRRSLLARRGLQGQAMWPARAARNVI